MYYAIVIDPAAEVIPANMVLLAQGNETQCETICENNKSVWPKYDIVRADNIFEARVQAFQSDSHRPDSKPARKKGVK